MGFIQLLILSHQHPVSYFSPFLLCILSIVVPDYMRVMQRFFGVIVHPRPMVPQKDIALYGYGSVSWKDRMEEWKKKQIEKLQVVKHQGNGGGGFHGDDLDDPDLPMYVNNFNFPFFGGSIGKSAKGNYACFLIMNAE